MKPNDIAMMSRRTLLLLASSIACRGRSEADVLAELKQSYAEQELGLAKFVGAEATFYPFGSEGLYFPGAVTLIRDRYFLYRIAKDGRSFTDYGSTGGLYWGRFALDGSPLEIYHKATQIGYNIEFAADNERAVYQDTGDFDRESSNGTPIAPERIWAGNARMGEFIMLGQEYTADGMLHAQTSWGPGNDRFVASLEDKIRLYAYGSWEYRVLTRGHEPRWSPDGRWLVYVGPDGRLKMGEMRNPGPFEERDLGIEAPRGVAWSPDSRFFLYATKRIHPRRIIGTYSLAVFRVSDGATAAISGPLWDNWTNEGFGWVYLPRRKDRKP